MLALAIIRASTEKRAAGPRAKEDPKTPMLLSLLRTLKSRAGQSRPAAIPLETTPQAEGIAEPMAAPGTPDALEPARAFEAAGDRPAAIGFLRAKLVEQPEHFEALVLLGETLLRDERPAEAQSLLEHAVRLRPMSWPTLHTLGFALQAQQNLPAAIGVTRLALALHPQAQDTRFMLATQLLLSGAYREAFLHFRARDTAGTRAHYPWSEFMPRWEGEPLDGRHLLIWTDWGGLGDELVLARYISMVRKKYRPAGLLVICTRENRRLLGHIEGVDAAISEGGALRFDCHIPLADLPCIFATELATVPGQVPYLRADPADQARWAERLAHLPGLKIGLCWSSGFWNFGTDFDQARLIKSVPLALLAELGGIKGVSLVSLQKGNARAELSGSGLAVHDFDADLRDMADTAALAFNLDLVLTVDTSVAHLAGALAKPVLVLMPHASGTFWLLQTERSPWYPTARILRQAQPREWAPVAARAVAIVRACGMGGRIDLFP
jgi:hypothetical protein